ncbi:hypothetical protein TNCV_3660891 [Trichonephila clavipes]|nr:hypothetical protein TNCV_3660891 [Trichonephila clavipes]
MNISSKTLHTWDLLTLVNQGIEAQWLNDLFILTCREGTNGWIFAGLRGCALEIMCEISSIVVLKEEALSTSSHNEKITVQKCLAIIAEVQGLGSNPEEGIDVCRCIVPSWHGGGTLNSCRASCKSSRVVKTRVVKGEERRGGP